MKLLEDNGGHGGSIIKEVISLSRELEHAAWMKT